MKQYLKMVDVFDYKVTGKDISGMASGGLANSLELAAHAINSHDELVQMNQELLEALGALLKEAMFINELYEDERAAHPRGSEPEVFAITISLIDKIKVGSA